MNVNSHFKMIFSLRSLFNVLMCQISILRTKTILFVLDSVWTRCTYDSERIG